MNMRMHFYVSIGTQTLYYKYNHKLLTLYWSGQTHSNREQAQPIGWNERVIVTYVWGKSVQSVEIQSRSFE